MERAVLYATSKSASRFFVICERDIVPASSLIGNVLHFGLKEQMDLDIDVFKEYFTQALEIKKAEQQA